MLRSFILIVAIFVSSSLYSQTGNRTEKDYSQKPYWIGMMDMEGVNFNEALRAYDIYWMHHIMPEEEGDRIATRSERAGARVSKKELKAIREEAEMRFQVKKFQHWKIINEPFVKENGNIMTAAERLSFHNQHQ